MRRAVALLAALTLISTGALAAGKRPTNHADRLVGNAKANKINGKAGEDRIFGRAGNDTLIGGGGDDIVKGEAGNDTLTGSGGQDDLFGGDGDDTIDARDGKLDYIDCGPGNDTVTVDKREDGVFDCETVNRPDGAP